MKHRASVKDLAEDLLHFTVAEEPNRTTIMSALYGLDPAERDRVRSEVMFLDVLVIANLMGTDRVKQCWPKSEDVLSEYLAVLKATVELGGANSERFLQSLEIREAAYHEVLLRPLNVARFAMGRTFAQFCGIGDNVLVETAGTGEFVSTVNHVGNLVSQYTIA
jgi:hypothetical protein